MCDPLEYPGHEAVAQFLAFPESQGEFKSFKAIAKHFKVTRMTVYRCSKDLDVLRRAEWLTLRNKTIAIVQVRREYPKIMEKAVEIAKRGNVQAMKFCQEQAWPEEDQDGGSSWKASLSLDERAAMDGRNQVPPSGALPVS